MHLGNAISAVCTKRHHHWHGNGILNLHAHPYLRYLMKTILKQLRSTGWCIAPARWFADAVRGRRGRTLQCVMAGVAILLVARLLLPHILLWRTNAYLAQSSDLRGSIKDLSIGLIRGRVTFYGVHLHLNVSGRHPTDELVLQEADVNMSWQHALRGQWQGSIILIHPILTLKADRSRKSQLTSGQAEPMNKPQQSAQVRITHAQIRHMEVVIRDDQSWRVFNGSLNAGNITVGHGKEETASLRLEGSTFGNGRLDVEASVRGLGNDLAIEATGRLVGAQLTALNEVSRNRGGPVFTTGTLDGYFDVRVFGGIIGGRVKPILRHVGIASYQGAQGDLATRLFWSLVVPVAEELLENDDAQQQAAIIPISGNLSRPDIGVVETIVTALANSFLRAILPGTHDLSLDH